MRELDKLPLAGQILTSKETIRYYMSHVDLSVTFNTVRLLATGVHSQEDYLRLYDVCSRLYHLSKLVYKGKTGICKPDKSMYEEYLFERRAETSDEVKQILEKVYNDEINVYQCNDEEPSVCVFQRLRILKEIWCRFLSYLYEQAYIPEYAYALDYVVNHADLPFPEYGEWGFFPTNYSDFNYTEGISEYFENISHGYV